MPLSVTCQCGARLEIDEKFLGKEIPCPDCQRPLPTTPVATPPPLDLPNHRKTGGLAVLSLTLALVGAATIVGTIAAIVTGVFALKQIAKHPNKIDGANFASAGIILGGVFTFLTLAALVSPFVFGIDQFLRELVMAGRITYTASDTFDIPDKVEVKRLDNWARWSVTNLPTANNESDVLILVNTTEDAYVSCLNALDVVVDEPEEKQKKVLEHVYKSELISLLGRLHGSALNREGTVVDKKLVANGRTQEVVLDLRLDGLDRRLLIQYPANEKINLRIVVGAARRNRFERLQKDFHKMFESVRFRN